MCVALEHKEKCDGKEYSFHDKPATESKHPTILALTITIISLEKQLRRMDSFFNNKHCVDEVVEIDYGNAGAFAIHRKVEDEVAGG